MMPTRIPTFLTDTNDPLWMNAKFIPEDVQSCPDILNAANDDEELCGAQERAATNEGLQ